LITDPEIRNVEIAYFKTSNLNRSNVSIYHEKTALDKSVCRIDPDGSIIIYTFYLPGTIDPSWKK